MDALFDRHLISFDDNGGLLISKNLSIDKIGKLDLLSFPTLEINENMLKYIKRHRNKFLEIERNSKFNNSNKKIMKTIR